MELLLIGVFFSAIFWPMKNERDVYYSMKKKKKKLFYDMKKKQKKKLLYDVEKKNKIR